MLNLRKIYEGKKVLVTGHTGFKGSWLVIWLTLLGAKVVGVSKSKVTNLSFCINWHQIKKKKLS